MGKNDYDAAFADLGDVPINTYSLDKSLAIITAFYDRVLAAGCRPLTMGGDHTIALPVLRAMAARHGPVALVHVDAHADVNDDMFGERIAHGMLAAGLIRRIGAVPNHYRLGFTANGMSVWDVDDAAVDRLGAMVGALPGVSHCYRRPRHLPDWPYNLFAMLHGSSREEVVAEAEHIAALLGSRCRARDILFSTRILKKTGLRLRD